LAARVQQIIGGTGVPVIAGGTYGAGRGRAEILRIAHAIVVAVRQLDIHAATALALIAGTGVIVVADDRNADALATAVVRVIGRTAVTVVARSARDRGATRDTEAIDRLSDTLAVRGPSVVHRGRIAIVAGGAG
jgi:hypothetical protein